TATRPSVVAAAPGECPTITAWKAEYWDNQELKGDPVLCRNETGVFVHHDWGTGSFGLSFPVNDFSARFTRTIYLPEGNTRFALGSDDGARLWVDGTLLINRWQDSEYTETWADMHLAEGNHRLRLDYFENGGDAKVTLTWTAVAECAPGVIYCEDFEDGRADNWRLLESWQSGAKWEVLGHEIESNNLYKGTGHRMSILQHEGWTDYRLRFRLRLIRGTVHLNYRHNESEDNFTRYFIGFSESEVGLSRQMGDVFTHLRDSEGEYALNRWYNIEIVGEGGHIQVYVDGELVLNYVDPNPILQGSISFETLDDSQAQIDDIEILPVNP
ncbi:MAG TPA: PA14 domain-containing protein, partial [Chloroflexota bacterium]|nr:PA14 domain-containing protein [Chloroflexota bacterium]